MKEHSSVVGIAALVEYAFTCQIKSKTMNPP